MSFGPDFIEFENVLLSQGRVWLRRYFRTDWQGLAQRWLRLESEDMAMQVFTLDCRQVDERFEDVLTALEGISRGTTD